MHPVHPNQRQLTKKESRISLQHFFQSAKDKHSPRTKLALQKKEQGKKSKSQKSSEMEKVEGVLISTMPIFRGSPPHCRSLKGFWM